MVITRFAPSPTGYPHLGTALICILNWVLAKFFDGKFIFRLDDTDNSRCKHKYIDSLIETLKWLNIDCDEGFTKDKDLYCQSSNIQMYKEKANLLISKGLAYKCFCSKEDLKKIKEEQLIRGLNTSYDGRCRYLSGKEKKKSFVIRLKTPKEGDCVFQDLIKGQITINWNHIDDQILIKEDGLPTYHLASVVDDIRMNVSHILRGEEWLNSVPKHILIFQGLNAIVPKFIHIPLIFDLSGKKLSKRNQHSSIFFLKRMGILPNALISFLIDISCSIDNEIVSLNELVKSFNMNMLKNSSSKFDINKLLFINKKYLTNNKNLDTLSYKWFFSEEDYRKLFLLSHNRINNFSQWNEIINNLITQDLTIPVVLFKSLSVDKILLGKIFYLFISLSSKLDKWTKDLLLDLARKLSQYFSINFAKIFVKLFFIAIYGKENGLPVFNVMEIMGEEFVLDRIKNVINVLLTKEEKESLLKEVKKIDICEE